jgi:hypothetical protein
MSEPVFSQVLQVPILIQIGEAGPLSTAHRNQIMEAIASHVPPGAFVVDDGVERGHMLSMPEAEHGTRHLSVGQHAPTAYVCNMFMENISISHRAKI